MIDEEIFQKFHSDFRPLTPPVPDLKWFEEGDDSLYEDEWGVTWRRKGSDGLYFEHHKPAYDSMPAVDLLMEKTWPDYSLGKRIAGLPEKASVH